MILPWPALLLSSLYALPLGEGVLGSDPLYSTPPCYCLKPASITSLGLPLLFLPAIFSVVMMLFTGSVLRALRERYICVC